MRYGNRYFGALVLALGTIQKILNQKDLQWYNIKDCNNSQCTEKQDCIFSSLITVFERWPTSKIGKNLINGLICKKIQTNNTVPKADLS